jgi:cytoskeletal protein RodZ
MLKTKQNKAIFAIVSGCAALIAVMVVINLAPENHPTSAVAAAEPQTSANTTTATSLTTSRRAVATLRTAPSAAVEAEISTRESAPATEITLAPVEIPSADIATIFEEFDVQVAPPNAVSQTAPPQNEQRPTGSATRIDGQNHVWHPVLGWVESGGSGRVTVMEIKSDGHRFYTDSQGNIRLDMVVTPSGEVISYDEYLQRNSR